MKKKFISIFLSLVLFSSFSIPASAKELNPTKNLSKVKNIQELKNLINGQTIQNSKDLSKIENIQELRNSIKKQTTQKPKDLTKVQNIQKLNNLSNGKLKLYEKDGQVFLSGKLSAKQTPGEKSAVNFLDENKKLFGIDNVTNELKTVEVKKDELGHTYVKFMQMINGNKVEGSLINVHFDKNGVIVSVNGKVEKNKSITTLGNNKISESKAVEIAKKQYTYKSLRNTPKAEKLIISKDNKNYEVYKVNISYMEPTIGNYDVYVETYSGNVIKTENNIRYDGSVTGSGIDVQGNTKSLNLYQSSAQYQMKDLTNSSTNSILTYDCDNSTTSGTLVTNSTNFFGTEDHKASVSAHHYADKVVDFYKNLFNRNSLDNSGMDIKSFTHYGYYYNNAFWDGYEMVYGDGDGYLFTYLSGDLDVVGHEMTHGVIDYTADLYYHNQSGALNESMADVFGVLIETYSKYNVADGGNWTFDAADWVVGDDIYTPYISGDALRSLSNPALYYQPDHMSDYEYLPDNEYGDWGGVHTNSGIPNKAAYLVAQSIGMEKTARIYYRALVNYMSQYTDFANAKNYLIQSAVDLYGENSAEATAVKNAFDSVGVGDPEPPVEDPYEPNDTMQTAYSIDYGTYYQSYISTPNDFDYYKLNVTNTGTTFIELSNLPCDYDLELFDSNGNWVTGSYNWNTTNESISFNATESGVYYILVLPFEGYSTTQKYTLKATLIQDCYEPNNTVMEAYPVNFGSTYEAYISGSNDLDFYSLNVINTGTMHIELSNLPEDYDLLLYNSNGSIVDFSVNEGTTTESIDFNATQTGKYYILVYSYYEEYNITQKYSLVVTGTGEMGDPYEPNDTMTTAYPINYGTTYQSFISAPNDWDFYSLNINSNKAIHVELSNLPNDNDFCLINSNGDIVAYSENWNTTGECMDFYATESGKYYILVFPFRGYSTTQKYSLKVTEITVPVPTSVKAESSSYNSINISWAAVSGANGYEVYRSTSSSGTYSLVSTTTSTSFTNTGLTTGTTYYYKVRAYTTVGSTKVYGNFSPVVNAKPVPAIPANFAATRNSSTSIKLTWSGVTGASGYEIYRATSNTGNYSYLTSTSNLSYINTGLTTGTTYYYKARAYVMVGTTKVYGNWTSVVSAKP
ncbi:M4 family metallopeptidase [Clostridium sp. SYSU_GA19001]|uniref:M4 family metallopeptidase n=1 Tax=Clostridium caldaquaticum TaxID=2940653 RepID=UPI00207780DD|nr:M4 family metallopeptidase [Clostridium caldaquaticum]MCM8710183.1 M4 family metallopeptidase [Clostridium caldaquaticum]